MTRTPDPANPQPGDRFTNDRGGHRTVLGVTDLYVWVDTNDGLSPVTVPRATFAHYRPVLPPLITEPVMLYERRSGADRYWTESNSDAWLGTLTGRKFEMRPVYAGGGDWSEVVS